MGKKLIDDILISMRKLILNEDIKYLCLTRDSMNRLFDDFSNEFAIEYEELGRRPTKDDVREYFNVPILVDSNAKKEYEILTAL